MFKKAVAGEHGWSLRWIGLFATNFVDKQMTITDFIKQKNEGKKRKLEDEDYELALKLQKQENDLNRRLAEKVAEIKKKKEVKGTLYNYFKTKK